MNYYVNFVLLARGRATSVLLTCKAGNAWFGLPCAHGGAERPVGSSGGDGCLGEGNRRGDEASVTEDGDARSSCTTRAAPWLCVLRARACAMTATATGRCCLLFRRRCGSRRNGGKCRLTDQTFCSRQRASQRPRQRKGLVLLGEQTSHGWQSTTLMVHHGACNSSGGSLESFVGVGA